MASTLVVRGLGLNAVILLIAAVGPAFSQSSGLGANCDLKALGVGEVKSFLLFDLELRYGLSRQDAGVMSLLVRYPLRVNDSRGSWYVNDAASLRLRFEEIFPPKVRAAVLEGKPETASCSYRGIWYGPGIVWINPQVRNGRGDRERYLIESINAEGRDDSHGGGYRVQFACETSQLRAIVDIDPKGRPRYRAWDKPHSLIETPDVEIPSGVEESQGTGACNHTVWTFSLGAKRIVVQDRGCYPDSNQPPEGARGRLDSSTDGKDTMSPWCF